MVRRIQVLADRTEGKNMKTQLVALVVILTVLIVIMT